MHFVINLFATGTAANKFDILPLKKQIMIATGLESTTT